jgi:hypothetical protein
VISQNSFLTTGFPIAQHFVLIYSSAPMVQIQESLNQYLERLNSGFSNITHAVVHSALVSALSTPESSPLVTWLFQRNCTFVNGSEICFLRGTQRWRNSSLFVELRSYDFIELQTQWRSMVALCGVAVTLMPITLRHEQVRWSDVSPMALFTLRASEYAIVLLFYHRRDDFDLGEMDGFGLVAVWAVSIPFYFLGVRFEMASRAYHRAHGFEFNPGSLTSLVLILCFLTGFTSFPMIAFLLKFSYWVPQVWVTAGANHRRSINLPFAIGMTIGQLMFAGSIVKYHPLFEGNFGRVMGPSIIWSGLQLVMILLQNSCGGAFFIPKESRQPRFDWRAQKPPPHTECSVCLDEIEENQAFLTTPCGHPFHDECLRRWMDEHADCPFCRNALPSIDIDPGEP